MLLAGLAAAAPACAASLASDFSQRIVAAHNAERARMGMPPLAWDEGLGLGAAAYAQQMAGSGMFQHSDRHARRGIGENLWMGTHGAFSFEAMVGGWTAEKRYFVPGRFPNNSSSGDWEDIGHYTQMIWPTTTRVGCALASSARIDYLVCRYSPAGNIDGQEIAADERGGADYQRPAVTALRGETLMRDARLAAETEEPQMLKTLKLAVGAAVLSTSGVPVMAPAYAHTTSYYHTHKYKGRTHYARKYCRRSNGTTGLVAGGVAGALVGHSVLGHGVLGTVGGAVGGAVAGRAIDRSVSAKRRCYWR